MVRRHEFTDLQWNRIKDLLPGRAGDPGRTAADNRLFVDAFLYVLWTGIPWPNLPGRFDAHNTVWRRFDRWCDRGVWEELFRASGEGGLREKFAELYLDSSSVRAHQVATTGRRRVGEETGPPTRGGLSAEAAAD